MLLEPYRFMCIFQITNSRRLNEMSRSNLNDSETLGKQSSILVSPTIENVQLLFLSRCPYCFEKSYLNLHLHPTLYCKLHLISKFSNSHRVFTSRMTNLLIPSNKREALNDPNLETNNYERDKCSKT